MSRKRKTSLSAKLRQARKENERLALECGNLLKQQEAEHECDRRRWARLGRVFKIADPMRRGVERIGYECCINTEEAYSLENAQQMYAEVFEKMAMEFGRSIFERNMKLMSAYFSGISSQDMLRAKDSWMQALYFDSPPWFQLDPAQAGQLWEACMAFITSLASKPH